MTSRTLASVLAAGCILAAAGPAAAQDPGGQPEIRSLQLALRHDEVRVDYVVSDAFNDDVLERIHSGIRLSFEHRVVLLGKRIAPLLPRRTLARTVVITTVRFDSLTRRYELERKVEGKSWPKETTPPELIERRSTSSPEEMRAWMTRLTDVPLPRPAPERGERFKVRVRTELGLRFLLYILPWPDAVQGEAWLDL